MHRAEAAVVSHTGRACRTGHGSGACVQRCARVDSVLAGADSNSASISSSRSRPAAAPRRVRTALAQWLAQWRRPLATRSSAAQRTLKAAAAAVGGARLETQGELCAPARRPHGVQPQISIAAGTHDALHKGAAVAAPSSSTVSRSTPRSIFSAIVPSRRRGRPCRPAYCVRLYSCQRRPYHPPDLRCTCSTRV